MDSLSQIVLGSSVAALAAPPKHRRAAILSGAVLGTLPDLDAVFFRLAGSDVVTEVTWHRGPSHSLMVLTLFSALLWTLARRWVPAVRAAPGRWWWAIWLPLFTHPLLDAFTVYGTQLFWPWPSPPVMGSSVFIIDPLYTVPLILAVIMAWRHAPPMRTPAAHGGGTFRRGQAWLLAGLLASTSYLGWSLLAKHRVEQAAAEALAELGLPDAPRVSMPLPFTTLLWRVVAMSPDGYLIGDRSLLADRGPMRFEPHDSDAAALTPLRDAAGVQRLLWFTHGFVSVRPQLHADGSQTLILTDLRLGMEPDYFFRYQIARQAPQGEEQAGATPTTGTHAHAHAHAEANADANASADANANANADANGDDGHPLTPANDTTAGVDAPGWLLLQPITRAPNVPVDRLATLGWVWRRLFDETAQR